MVVFLFCAEHPADVLCCERSGSETVSAAVFSGIWWGSLRVFSMQLRTTQTHPIFQPTWPSAAIINNRTLDLQLK